MGIIVFLQSEIYVNEEDSHGCDFNGFLADGGCPGCLLLAESFLSDVP